MASIFLLLLFVCCVPALRADEELFSMDVEEMHAIQDRLARLEGLEKTIKSLVAPEEAREDCLPEGAGCSFSSGLSCCGIRMRCIAFDHYTPQRGGPNKWHSACWEYKAGVAMDEIAKFFKNFG